MKKKDRREIMSHAKEKSIRLLPGAEQLRLGSVHTI